MRSAASGSVAPEAGVTATCCALLQLVAVNTSVDGSTVSAPASPSGAATLTVTGPLGRLFSATV